MSKQVQLAVCEPAFSTYHYQMIACVVAAENPHLRKWFLNNCVMLQCERKFLRGFTSPMVDVALCFSYAIPQIFKQEIHLEFAGDYVRPIIRNMLDAGYYVAFEAVDDYYIEGKTFYGERHYGHDGLLCGYDDAAGTYRMMAYDKNWVCRLFDTPQTGFEEGVLSMGRQGVWGALVGMRANQDPVELDLPRIRALLRSYLDADFRRFPPEKDGKAKGIVVHDYIALYLDQLIQGVTPYERMDWRVFRMLWEHKRHMLERIRAVEEALSLGPETGDAYEAVVRTCDTMRALYARYHIKRRDDLLPMLKERLAAVTASERTLLGQLVAKMEAAGV